MIATELMARSTDTARLGLAKFGLMKMKTSATTITAANRPPTRKRRVERRLAGCGKSIGALPAA